MGLGATSGWLPRGVLVLCAGGWGVAMMTLGLLAVFDWPGRLGVHGTPMLYLGAALTAAGLFVCAVLAGRMFPRADGRVVAFCELLPWAALAGVLTLFVGGLL